jgi:hypothetical protein
MRTAPSHRSLCILKTLYLGRWQPFGKTAVDDILPTWLLRALGFGSNPNAGHVAGPGAGIKLPFLAISRRMDEVWQLLHGMCSFRNPLAVDTSLAKYLFGSLQKRMSLGEKIDAIISRESFKKGGIVAQAVVTFMCGIATPLVPFTILIKNTKWLWLF